MRTLRRLLLTILLLMQTSAWAVRQSDFCGEHLQYRIHYGLIAGGNIEFSANRSKYGNVPAVHVKIDMYTTGLADKLFGMHDIFESYFNPHTGLPYRFTRDVHEGSYMQWEQVDYYNDYVVSTLKGRYDIDKRYHDVVSAIYALRCHDFASLTPDTILTYPIYYEEQIFNMRVIYKGIDEIKLNKHTYRCHVFYPVLSNIPMFEKKSHPVSIWISDDMRRVPVYIKINMRLGAFKVKLIE